MKSYSKHIRETAQLAYPVVIGQLGHTLMAVVDSAMVGRLGAVPLAAVSLAGGIFFIFMVIGLGVTFAISPLVAMAIGRGEKEECGKILRQSLIVNIFLSFILAGIIFWFAEIIIYFDQPPEVAAQAKSYLQVLSYSVFPFMLFQTYRQFIEGLSIMRPAMFVAILANIVNALVNWLLIFGNLGFPRLGLDGAGWATFSSRVFMAGVLIWYIVKAEKFKAFDPTLNYRTLDFAMMKKVLRIGLPTGFQYFFEVGAFAFTSVLIGWFGAKQLAAHQIVINLATITYMVAMGISAAAAIRVGNAYGKKNVEEIKRAGYSAIMMSASFMFIAALSFVIFRNVFPTFYIDDASVLSYAANLMIIAALFQISDGTQAVGLGVLRGILDVKIPTIITFIAYWVIGIPVGAFLGFYFNMEVEGVWIGLFLGLTASAFLLVSRFRLRVKSQRYEIK